MTSRQISEQIDAIRSATAKASSSKESAAAFLVNAGIIEEQTNSSISGRSTVKSKKSRQEINQVSASR